MEPNIVINRFANPGNIVKLEPESEECKKVKQYVEKEGITNKGMLEVARLYFLNDISDEGYNWFGVMRV